MPFEPVPIIRSAQYGDLSAPKVCEMYKITSMNEAEKLAKAKEDVYNDGFYTGVLIVGEFAGKTVQEAKPLIKQKLIENGEALSYYEPEGKCVSRSGDACVVSLCD